MARETDIKRLFFPQSLIDGIKDESCGGDSHMYVLIIANGNCQDKNVCIPLDGAREIVTAETFLFQMSLRLP
jgi:hypothetical protein